jgi:hypothetical protein
VARAKESDVVAKPHWATPKLRMGTSEARNSFSKIVQSLGKLDTPSGSLVDNAIEVGPQRKGGVWLIPEVDGRAAIEREQSLNSAVDELEGELEDIGIGLLLEERLERSGGGVISGTQLLRDIGLPELADGLPE